MKHMSLFHILFSTYDLAALAFAAVLVAIVFANDMMRRRRK